jgi:hypothetical protein
MKLNIYMLKTLGSIGDARAGLAIWIVRRRIDHCLCGCGILPFIEPLLWHFEN